MQDPNRNRLPKNPFPGNGGDKNDKTTKDGPKRPRIPTWFVGALLVSIAVWYAYQYMSPSDGGSRASVPYSTAVSQISSGNVKSATIGTSNLDLELAQPILWDSENSTIVAPDAANAASFKATSKLTAKIPPALQQSNSELTDLLASKGVTFEGKDESS